MSVSSPRGVLYVATQTRRYVEEALVSAESVKRKTSFRLPITIATDQPDCPVICCGRESGVFDEVVIADQWPTCRIPWARGQLVRINQLRKSPYEQTLHLDTDTRIVGDQLEWLFNLLANRDVAMAEAEEQSSYSRLHFQRPLFNTGVILYKRSQLTDKWLAAWWDVSWRNFRSAQLRFMQIPPELKDASADSTQLRRLLCMDQISLAAMMYPGWNEFGLNVQTLEPIWNYRRTDASATDLTCPIQILHERRASEEAHASQLETALRSMKKTT